MLNGQSKQKARRTGKKISLSVSVLPAYLTVSFAFDDDYSDVEDKVLTIVGKKYESGSGAGFGARDINFQFPTLRAANAAVTRLSTVGFKIQQ